MADMYRAVAAVDADQAPGARERTLAARLMTACHALPLLDASAAASAYAGLRADLLRHGAVEVDFMPLTVMLMKHLIDDGQLWTGARFCEHVELVATHFARRPFCVRSIDGQVTITFGADALADLETALTSQVVH